LRNSTQAEDKELTQLIPLKRMAPYRDQDWVVPRRKQAKFRASLQKRIVERLHQQGLTKLDRGKGKDQEEEEEEEEEEAVSSAQEQGSRAVGAGKTVGGKRKRKKKGVKKKKQAEGANANAGDQADITSEVAATSKSAKPTSKKQEKKERQKRLKQLLPKSRLASYM
jgi:protein KRI1